jgi:hypothetical protein
MATVFEQKTVVPPRPPFWLTMSVAGGNLLQLAGLVLGAAILFWDAHLPQAPGVIRVLLMLVGFMLIYITCHSLGHYLVGTLVGIHFRKYGVRGTDHPQDYPPVFRQMMSAMPTFSAITEKDSMAKASRTAKALMFAAGETSSSVCSVLAGLYAWRSGIPGGLALFVFTVLFAIGATYTTAVKPRGDYAKALQALRQTRG